MEPLLDAGIECVEPGADAALPGMATLEAGELGIRASAAGRQLAPDLSDAGGIIGVLATEMIAALPPGEEGSDVRWQVGGHRWASGQESEQQRRDQAHHREWPRSRGPGQAAGPSGQRPNHS